MSDFLEGLSISPLGDDMDIDAYLREVDFTSLVPDNQNRMCHTSKDVTFVNHMEKHHMFFPKITLPNVINDPNQLMLGHNIATQPAPTQYNDHSQMLLETSNPSIPGIVPGPSQNFTTSQQHLYHTPIEPRNSLLNDTQQSHRFLNETRKRNQGIAQIQQPGQTIKHGMSSFMNLESNPQQHSNAPQGLPSLGIHERTVCKSNINS